MREDMAKVIVERPRRGASGRLKGRLRGNRQAQPIKQGMKFLLADTKSLNENLAPLRRYLARQVGRPWSKVYSERGIRVPDLRAALSQATSRSSQRAAGR